MIVVGSSINAIKNVFSLSIYIFSSTSVHSAVAIVVN